MQGEIKSVRNMVAPNELRDMKIRHATSGIKDPQWEAFFRDFDGDVDATLIRDVDIG